MLNQSKSKISLRSEVFCFLGDSFFSFIVLAICNICSPRFAFGGCFEEGFSFTEGELFGGLVDLVPVFGLCTGNDPT